MPHLNALEYRVSCSGPRASAAGEARAEGVICISPVSRRLHAQAGVEGPGDTSRCPAPRSADFRPEQTFHEGLGGGYCKINKVQDFCVKNYVCIYLGNIHMVYKYLCIITI